MRLITISTVSFGVVAALFVLNRFINLLPHSQASTIGIIVLYALIPPGMLLAGLILLYRKKIIGLWILIASVSYLLVRHTIIYRSLAFRPNAFAIPENIADRFTVTHVDIIFAFEVVMGILTIYSLVKNKKQLRAAGIES
jgi:hypothetical protein